jgi:hypothetical protein
MTDERPTGSDERPSEVLGGLPRSRPHRRSEKRAAPAAKRTPTRTKAATPRPATANAKPAGAKSTASKPKQPAKPTALRGQDGAANRRTTARPKTERLRQPAQPAGTPNVSRKRKPVPATGADILGTAVQAAAELAEIGLTVGARAIRRAVSRLPRP